MSAALKQQQVTVVYKNQDLPKKAFSTAETIAYNHFCGHQFNTDSINTLIVEVAKLLDLDKVNYNGILLGAHPAQTKFLNFISIVEGQDDDDYTARKQFIEFLLNSKKLAKLGKAVEEELVKELGDQIEILRGSERANANNELTPLVPVCSLTATSQAKNAKQTVKIFLDAVAFNLFELSLKELIYSPEKFSSSLQEAEDGNSLPGPSVESTDTIDFTTAKNLTAKDLKIVRPSHVMTFDNDHYKLTEEDKGFALILNIIEYESQKTASGNLIEKIRHGARFDSFYMEHVWRQLGYKEVTIEDERAFTKARVDKIIDQFRDKCNKRKPRSAVVFIGGHGEFGQLKLSNFKERMHIYRDIINKFTTGKCPGLEGKPKIFIIAACQEWGNIDELPIPVEAAAESVDGSTSSKQLTQTPPLDDMIVCYSTVPGFFSHRSWRLGTVYIYCLTKIMIEEAHRKHFKEIHELVEKTMAKVITTKAINQRPNYHVYGFKELYFHVLPHE